MGITLSIASGRVDQGDTKRLTVIPLDEQNDPLDPAALTATFTAPTGEETSYEKAAFTDADGVFSVAHTFSEAGHWKLEVTSTDASGASERESGTVVVHP